MYIGDQGSWTSTVYEVIDNSIDEALAGFCDTINLTINEDGSITVVDNGRGVPTGMHESVKSAAEVVMTYCMRRKIRQIILRVSGGTARRWCFCCKAHSEWLELTIWREGKEHHQRYERGVPMTELEIVGDTENRGTKIRFMPDKEIFTSIEFKPTY